MSQREPTEEELRAAYEAELKRITVPDVVLQTIVSLINLGGRRMGLAPGAEDERDLDQVRDAIDAVRALLPLAERSGGPDLRPIRDALSQLQLAYAKERGSAAQGAPAAVQGDPTGGPPKPTTDEAETPAGPGPAQSSGRLWVPGQ